MIYMILGKSSTGKDTIFKTLMSDADLGLIPLVGYTTRPKRSQEEDGREYYFVARDELRRLREQGKVIEQRTYHTVHGDWDYFTVDDGRVTPEHNYLYIGTLESFVKLREYYGEAAVTPIYIEVEDGIRLMRALLREREQAQAKYAELCRRYLADEKDFSEENLRRCGITKRYDNSRDMEECVKSIREDLMTPGLKAHESESA